MHDDDLKAADATQSSAVARIGSAAYACNLENITAGKESQQTIILEGGGSIRARNITTGDGSVQLIGQLSDVKLPQIVRSWDWNSEVGIKAVWREFCLDLNQNAGDV